MWDIESCGLSVDDCGSKSLTYNLCTWALLLIINVHYTHLYHILLHRHIKSKTYKPYFFKMLRVAVFWTSVLAILSCAKIKAGTPPSNALSCSRPRNFARRSIAVLQSPRLKLPLRRKQRSTRCLSRRLRSCNTRHKPSPMAPSIPTSLLTASCPTTKPLVVPFLTRTTPTPLLVAGYSSVDHQASRLVTRARLRFLLPRPALKFAPSGARNVIHVVCQNSTAKMPYTGLRSRPKSLPCLLTCFPNPRVSLGLESVHVCKRNLRWEC